MKRILTFALCSLLFAPLWAQPKSGHYSEIDGKSGSALFQAVSAAANKGYHSLSYDGLYDAYKKTDMLDGRIWDMYSTCGFSTSNKCGSYKNECDCYNREHSIPKSWWGGSTSRQGCDIFHVIPTDGKVNGMRSNYPFGEVGSASYTSKNGSKVGSSSFSGYSGKVFEPIDEYKGDLARGVLGAMTKWKGNWTEGNGNSTFNGSYTESSNFGLKTYAVNLFLKWHRQDPVSQKELDRNNGIEQTQGNRNPFIDYPELVEYIWGSKKGQAVSLSSLCLAYNTDCTGENPNPGDGGNDTGDTGDTGDNGDNPDDGNTGGEDNPTEVPDGDYQKVLTALADYSGIYLIVNEEKSVILNAADMENIDSRNTMSVTIDNSTIAATNEIDAASLTIAKVADGYSLCTQAGAYLSGANKEYVVTQTPEPNNIMVSGGNATIESNNCTLWYNASASMFRFYSSYEGEKIQLYKKEVVVDALPTVNANGEYVFTAGAMLMCEAIQPVSLQVFDYTGRLILQANDITTFETTLASGLYLVRLGNTTTKIRIYE